MINAIVLKRLLLVFWAVWLSIVFLSNLADACKELRVLPDSWEFASGNFGFIQKTTAKYPTPNWLNAVLFAGVIVWEAVAAALFWRAAWFFQGGKSAHGQIYQAFTASLLLWAGFLIADEIFIAYPIEGTHLRLFTAHLATLLAIELLPETAQDKGYRGMAMEGWMARWYAGLTGKSLEQFREEARQLSAGLAEGSSVLEVAPGPGYLSVALAKQGNYRISGLDISNTFVKIASENAANAGVSVDFQQGNASAMPFADGCFDLVICRAAFKNFSEPVKALSEMHRVLRPGGRALIHDLDRLASPAAIDAAVGRMNLGWFNALLTRWIFRFFLLRRAYSQDDFRRMALESAAGQCEIAVEDISLKVTIRK